LTLLASPMAMGSQEMSAQAAYDAFWPKAVEEIRTLDLNGLKHQELPLARIKKIMKLDEDVKMISAEAPVSQEGKKSMMSIPLRVGRMTVFNVPDSPPFLVQVLFAKAAEMFITELTMRAWIHTEDNKRRTLQRNDIAMAITKYDQFDFLIDIVPRDDIKPAKAGGQTEGAGASVTAAAAPPAPAAAVANNVRVIPDQVSYYFTMAQQQQQQAQQQQQQVQLVQQPAAVSAPPSTSSGPVASTNVTSTVAGQVMTPSAGPSNPSDGQGPPAAQQQAAAAAQLVQQQPQVIQLQATQMVSPMAPQSGGIQIVQQIVGPNGEIQQIPIQLTSQQLQMIRTQMTGKPMSFSTAIESASSAGPVQQQPLVIQTAPIQASSMMSVQQPATAQQGQQMQFAAAGGQVYMQPQAVAQAPAAAAQPQD